MLYSKGLVLLLNEKKTHDPCSCNMHATVGI